MTASILRVAELPKMLVQGVRPARVLKGMAIGALLTFATVVPAQAPLEAPADGEFKGAEFRMTFSQKEGDVRPLAQAHRNTCDALGAARCRVVQFMSGEMSLISRFLLAPGTTQAFMARISKSSGNAGFSVDSNLEDRRIQRKRAELELEKQLQLARREKLVSLRNTQSSEILQLIERKQSEPRRVCRRPQLLRGRGYDE